MTEGEFLNRFQRQPNGAWACTKPIKVDGPSGPVIIGQGRNLIKWPRSNASLPCPQGGPLAWSPGPAAGVVG